MSICSNASELSICYDGQDISLEHMLDKVITGGIQKHLNQLQLLIRDLAQSDDRNDTFEEVVQITDDIEDDIDEMIILFDELKQIVKDIAGKAENAEEKAWLKQHKIERKALLAKKMIDAKEKLKSLKVKKGDTDQPSSGSLATQNNH